MKNKENDKIIATNRKAHFNYFLSDFTEAGLVLLGTEIKSLRQGHCSLSDSYIAFKKGEAFIENMDISIYKEGNIFNHEPKRERKILLHKEEIRKLQQVVKKEGITVVPTKCYLHKGKAKLEIAIGKGKNAIDKRETIKNRDIQRKLKENTHY